MKSALNARDGRHKILNQRLLLAKSQKTPTSPEPPRTRPYVCTYNSKTKRKATREDSSQKEHRSTLPTHCPGVPAAVKSHAYTSASQTGCTPTSGGLRAWTDTHFPKLNFREGFWLFTCWRHGTMDAKFRCKVATIPHVVNTPA